jgi:hypothetical protein
MEVAAASLLLPPLLLLLTQRGQAVGQVLWLERPTAAATPAAVAELQASLLLLMV